MQELGFIIALTMKRNLLPLNIVLLFSMLVSACFADTKTNAPVKALIDKEAVFIACKTMPKEIRLNIEKNYSDFELLLNDFLKMPSEITVLVDKKHPLPKDFESADLVSLNDYPELTVSRKDLRLREVIMKDVLAMNKKAQAEGITLVFSSSYRSYDYQEGVYARYVAQEGKASADRFSAPPGKSQHQLGTAIDFGSISDAFAKTKEAAWLTKNAGLFGFSLSFPKGMEALTGYKYESWHYRYIGILGVRLQDEYFLGVQQYLFEFVNEYKASVIKDK